MGVLVLRALGVGVRARAVPGLRGRRAARPAEEVGPAAPAGLAPLARLTGAVDRLVPVPGLSGPDIPVPPPRLAVNLHGRGPASHRLLARTRPERKLAFACPDAGFPDGPQWTPDEHEVRRWCRMLAWYRIIAVPSDLMLHRPAVPPVACGVTIVHPGAKDPRRRWPATRYAEGAHRLRQAGHDVVVTGSPAEARLAGQGAGLAGPGPGRGVARRADVGGPGAPGAHGPP